MAILFATLNNRYVGYLDYANVTVNKTLWRYFQIFQMFSIYVSAVLCKCCLNVSYLITSSKLL